MTALFELCYTFFFNRTFAVRTNLNFECCYYYLHYETSENAECRLLLYGVMKLGGVFFRLCFSQ